jgi:hypothetical protein
MNDDENKKYLIKQSKDLIIIKDKINLFHDSKNI